MLYVSLSHKGHGNDKVTLQSSGSISGSGFVLLSHSGLKGWVCIHFVAVHFTPASTGQPARLSTVENMLH